MRNVFCEYIKEEIKIWNKRKPPFSTPAWHISENFVEGQKGKSLLNLLYKNGKLRRLYKTKERISKIISRAFNVYINILSEKKKEGYKQGLATKVFNDWIKEINSPRSSGVILTPVICLSVNRKIRFGEIELFPIAKSGKIIELEAQIYKFLEYPEKRKSVTFTAFSQSYFPFFMHASALRIRYVFNKPDTFFDYSSFPPPGYEKAKQKIDSFITLLRLFKGSDLRIENYFSSLSSLFVPSFVSYSGSLSQRAGKDYSLVDEKEIRRLRAFFNKLFPALQKLSRLPSSMQIGIEYFNSSFQKMQTHERFIDLMIALDALFGVKYETTYRVPLRVACFLEKDKTKRIEIRNEIEKILRLRGSLFHGDVHPASKRKEIENSKIYTEDIVRRAIVELLTQHLKGKITDNYKNTMEVDYIL